MTIPHMMNCQHVVDGWCHECVMGLGEENVRLRTTASLSVTALRAIVKEGIALGTVQVAECHRLLDIIEKLEQ